MSQLVNPNLIKNLEKYGITDKNACFHCGSCTAICSLTEKGVLFPRKQIRAIQMGLKDKLAASLEPWMCYYCGDCSDKCPRDANPAEMIMALRRYLIAFYDWTGLSGLFSKSLKAFIISLILVAASIISISARKGFDYNALMEFGKYFEPIAIIAVLAFIILPNIIRMYYYTIIKGKAKAPVGSYITRFFSFIWHMFTQPKALKCDNNSIRWFIHFAVVLGYLILLFTTIALHWVEDNTNILYYINYVVAAIVTICTLIFIFMRMAKKTQITKNSHQTDWFFVIWLFLLGLTTLIVHLTANNVEIVKYIYLIHLIILAQWAILIVPFGKWMHFMYRSFGIYFSGMKLDGLKQQGKI